jgi:thiamine pyrophosphate-dependent acetolactate synthase large subunit-like protein
VHSGPGLTNTLTGIAEAAKSRTPLQFPDTDFTAIARGHGARAVTVRTLQDLAPVRDWVNESAPGVFVIDGKISPDLEADWHAEHFP